MATRIFYDGDCPFCRQYIRLTRIRSAAGEVELINLRDDAGARQRFTDAGLDPDEGMLVETNGRLYHGADALTVISALSSGSDGFNRINAAIFRHATVSRLLYPLMRAGRNATLFFLGRDAMRNKDPAEAALRELFSRFLGIFTVLHIISFYWHYSPLTLQVTTLPLLGLGAALVFKPESGRLFVLTMILLAADGWLQAPVSSNHTIIKNFLVLAFLLAGFYQWMRGRSLERTFRDVRPVARSLLLIMYVFGIFHKINSDFLNPAISCAVELWRVMPQPLSLIDNTPMHYLAIYGTFIVEGIIILLLIWPRWRHFGIGLGIAFHSLLALSGYALYPVFSTLSIMLHVSFLSPAAALQITHNPRYRFMARSLNSIVGITYVICAFFLYAIAVLLQDYNVAALAWLALVLLPLAALLQYNKKQCIDPDRRQFFWSPLPALNIITVLFFINCLLPYMGLKTAQTINMFSNLQLEGGRNNHLVFQFAPAPFDYLDDLVVIHAAENAPQLEYMATQEEQAMVYYQFLSELEKHPQAHVTYQRNDMSAVTRSAYDILADDGDTLHPQWIRKYFHFRPVSLHPQTMCEQR